jgi:hypothetical protein
MEEPIAVGFVEMFVGLPEPDQPCAEFLPQPLKEEYLRMKAWKARPPG